MRTPSKLAGLGWLLWASSAAAQFAGTQPTAGVRPVNEAQARAVAAVALPDADYTGVGDERAAALSLALSAALKQGAAASPSAPPGPPGQPISVPELPEVLALGAPKRLTLTRTPALPVLVAARETGLRRWQVEWAQNARIVVVSLADGRAMSNRLVVSPKRQAAAPPSMSTPRPNPVNAASVATGVKPFADVLSGLRPNGEAWPRGRYALTVFNFDWLSNTVVVDMVGGSAPPAPVARQPFPPLLVRRDEVAASFDGLDFRLPPPGEAGRPQQVQVALSLPAQRVVLAPSADAPGQSLLIGALLLVQRDAEWPLRAELAIPVVAAASASAGAEAKVRSLFGFDLKAALPGGVPAGAYQCYLVFGETVVGPRSLTVE